MKIRYLVVATLAVGAVFALSSPAQSADKATLTAPCATPAVTQAIVDQRVAELREEGKSVWVVREVNYVNPNTAGVIADKDVVWIDEEAPCGFLRAIVDHEWGHIQQDRKYPGRATEAYGGMDRVESIADCVAYVLGNPDYRPYLAKRGYGCTEYEIESAKTLINTYYTYKKK